MAENSHVAAPLRQPVALGENVLPPQLSRLSDGVRRDGRLSPSSLPSSSLTLTLLLAGLWCPRALTGSVWSVGRWFHTSLALGLGLMWGVGLGGGSAPDKLPGAAALQGLSRAVG